MTGGRDGVSVGSEGETVTLAAVFLSVDEDDGDDDNVDVKEAMEEEEEAIEDIVFVIDYLFFLWSKNFSAFVFFFVFVLFCRVDQANCFFRWNNENKETSSLINSPICF